MKKFKVGELVTARKVFGIEKCLALGIDPDTVLKVSARSDTPPTPEYCPCLDKDADDDED